MSEAVSSIVSALGLAMSKPYGVTVVVFEHSNGAVDQTISISEFASSAQENVFKYQWISDAVIEALNGKNEAGSGGAFREMGEMFQAAAAQAGGDVNAAMAGFGAAAAAHGQGKKKK